MGVLLREAPTQVGVTRRPRSSGGSNSHSPAVGSIEVPVIIGGKEGVLRIDQDLLDQARPVHDLSASSLDRICQALAR